jgi:hypothetical protein
MTVVPPLHSERVYRTYVKKYVRPRLPVGAAVLRVFQSKRVEHPPTLGRRVYPSAISATIHRRRHPCELQRGIRRLSAR